MSQTNNSTGVWLVFIKSSLAKVLNLNYKVPLIDTTYKINNDKMGMVIMREVTPLNILGYTVFAFPS